MLEKTLRRSLLLFCVLLNTILISHTVNADYILTAPPRENGELGKETYEPLANYLSQLLGDKVVYQQPSGWFDYTQKMRDGRYDIIFDGPHFAAWRVKHLQHIPIAVLPGTLDFVLIAKANDQEIIRTKDLNGKKICGMLSPIWAPAWSMNYLKTPSYNPLLKRSVGA